MKLIVTICGAFFLLSIVGCKPKSKLPEIARKEHTVDIRAKIKIVNSDSVKVNVNIYFKLDTLR